MKKPLTTMRKRLKKKIIWMLEQGLLSQANLDVVLQGWVISEGIYLYTTTGQKNRVNIFSWLANKLLELKDKVYPLIKLRLENGNSACFWHDNWSPLGCLASLLNVSASRLGIPLNSTVAALNINGAWRLPPARTDALLQLHAHLTTAELSANEDYNEWELAGKVYEKFKTGDIYTYLKGPQGEVNWASERLYLILH